MVALRANRRASCPRAPRRLLDLTDIRVGRPHERALPSGDVTFVLTDIEGSTRLFRELGDRYVAALNQHNQIIRDAFAAFDGVEVKNDGDSFFFAFPRAEDAALAAAAAQRRLAVAAWPHHRPFRVRMGIHTGWAVPVDGDYISLDVHRAARITAAARGGQILASDATARRLWPDGDAELDLRAIGSCWLKDFEEFETLYVITDDPAKVAPRD